jgi:hypothetical protein
VATPATAQQKVAQRLEFAQLQNRATRLPMLAERITKLYLQIGLKLPGSRASRSLAAVIGEFEGGLREQVAQAPTPEIRENYQLLELLWVEFKAIAQKPPDLDNARVLVELDEEVAWIAAKGAVLVRDYAKAQANDLVRAAGEARLLSQHIARLYLQRSWGIGPDTVAGQLASADAEFRKAMARLSEAPQNTPDIRSELQLAENQYIFLGQAAERLNTGRNTARELEFISKTCDNILEVMDRATRLYEGVRS